jgi:hypothetical protein
MKHLSHAVAVVLYELCDIEIGSILLADRHDLDLLYDHIENAAYTTSSTNLIRPRASLIFFCSTFLHISLSGCASL